VTAFQAPSVDLQIHFYEQLRELRERLLLDALFAVVAESDITLVDRQLAELVSAQGLCKMAALGLRGELLFPVPCLLQQRPSLLGYYRLLLGVSQKPFYGKESGFGRFRTMETANRLSVPNQAVLEKLCRALCTAASQLLQGVGTVTRSEIHELTLLTLGPQLRGGALNRIGSVATRKVFELIREIVAPALQSETARSLTLENAAGRLVRVEFAQDPDTSIREVLRSESHRNLVAIEIKGGSDVSNIHNRIGEAEKSHQKARRARYLECWTLIGVEGISLEQARRQSPSTQRLYVLAKLEDRDSSEYRDFKEQLSSLMSIEEIAPSRLHHAASTPMNPNIDNAEPMQPTRHHRPKHGRQASHPQPRSLRARWRWLSRPLAALLTLLIATGGALAAQGAPAGQPPAGPQLLPLPETVIDDMTPAVQAQLVAARQQLEAAAPAGKQVNVTRLAEAYGAMGRVAMAHGLAELAEASLENARTLAPNDATWPYLAGVLYESEGRWAEAAAALEGALAIDASDAAARLRLGRTLARDGQRDAARAQLERAARTLSTSAAARQALAELDGKTPAGEAPASFPDPRVAAVLALRGSMAPPPSVGADDPLEQIRLMIAQGDAAAAVERARAGLAAKPDSSELRLLLGRALTVAGDREAALAEYRKLLAQEGLDHRTLGLVHLRVARLLDPADPNTPPPPAAMESYRKAVELTPNFANARLGLADALMRSGDFTGAVTHLTAMREVAPDDPSSYTALSAALTRAGRHQEAHDTLEAGHRQMPSDPTVAYAYARLLALSPDPALRDGEAALGILLPMFQRQPSLALAETVAAALATAGNFEDAVRWQQQVIDNAIKEGAKERYLALQQRNLELYQAGKSQP
jgi:tetratricopeptide (TPR) repeat protein